MTRPSRRTAEACDPSFARTEKASGLRRHGLTLAISGVLALGLGPGPGVAAQALPATFDLSSLDGNNGFVLDGEAELDYSGSSVSGAGDVNGDGINDLIIGARRADPNGIDQAGRSYVVFGSNTGLASPLTLSSLDGSNGFVLDGEAEGDSSGRSVSGAGDINGDGIDDLIIGAPGPSLFLRAGRSYVVFGSNTGLPSPVALSGVDGSNGFVLDGEAAYVRSGYSVSGAGDVNGDGIDDLVIGVRGYEGSTRSYVVFGSDTGLPNPFAISSLDGSNGFALDTDAGYDGFGRSVGVAGDINGDGLDDLIIGAPGGFDSSNPVGRSYVVFGSDAGLPDPFAMSSLDGSNGLVIDGEAGVGRAGASVSGAGDVNGDGIDDLIIGAPGNPLSTDVTGRSYVVFGSNTGLPSPFALSSLDGSNGFVLEGEFGGDQSGSSVSAAGDVNGDGIDDLIIGARAADPNGTDSGRSYVVFGSNTGLPSPFALSSLDGSNGFAIDGESESDAFGRSVSAAGDVNGDGIDDLIIGAPYADPNGINSGRSYVVFGGVPALGLMPDSVDFGDGSVGVQSVARTVLIRNTGTGDLVIGALGISGANAGDFALGSDTCSNQTLGVAASCSFDVTLTPTIFGMLAARIDIPSDAPGSPDTIGLSASVAVPVPALNHWVLGLLATLLGVFGIRRARNGRSSTPA